MAILSENMVFSKTRTQDLRNVKQLNCWGSELADVSLVRQMPFVQVLSLSVNSIKSLADFSYCKNLQELYLRDNKVSDLSQLLHLQDLPNLRKLWLSGNPCSDVHNYRMIVLKILPHLEMLDNIPVSRDELVLADNMPLELDEETGEIVVPEPHSAVVRKPPASSIQSAPSDRGADDEDEEYEEESVPVTAAVPPVHRQHSTPEPQPSNGHNMSHRIPNQRFSYESDSSAAAAAGQGAGQRVRQPPAHPVTPVLAASHTHSNNATPVCGNNGSNNGMVRSVSIADYSGFSGDSYSGAGHGQSVKSGSSGGGMQQRMLPKGGRNRVSAHLVSHFLLHEKSLLPVAL